MGSHLIDGEFQSDKYPTTPRGKVPLSVKDPVAQDLLWSYAQRRRSIDAEFSSDLEAALCAAGYEPRNFITELEFEREWVRTLTKDNGELIARLDKLTEAFRVALDDLECIVDEKALNQQMRIEQWRRLVMEIGGSNG